MNGYRRVIRALRVKAEAEAAIAYWMRPPSLMRRWARTAANDNGGSR